MKPKKDSIIMPGKGEVDFHEFSNVQQKDMVPILKKLDEVIDICFKEKLPFFNVLISSKHAINSKAYSPEWDNENLDKLRHLVSSTITAMANHFGAVLEFKGFDFTKIKGGER